MRRGPIFVAAMALSCLPAVTGLVGNQSFSHTVPVRVPSQARVGSPEVADATIRQPASASASGAAKPSQEVQREDVGREANDDSQQVGNETSGSADSSEPHQSADLQRGRPVAGEPGDDHRSLPIPASSPPPDEDRDSGRGSHEGQPAGGSDHERDSRATSDDGRGHQ